MSSKKSVPATADEFIDGADPFDPMIVDEYEGRQRAEVKTNDVVAKAMLSRRGEAYRRVFTAGERSQADIDVVLADLMWFCRADGPTFDRGDGQHAEVMSRFKEGRREVFTRIKHHTRLDADTLLLMYTDALTKQTQL